MNRILGTDIYGSSPLTRGKRYLTNTWCPVSGLIPAHAGKTRIRGPDRPHRTAHPRSRGENSRLRMARTTRRGSSPLTRGKRARQPQVELGEGLIPAHAGKTLIRVYLAW